MYFFNGDVCIVSARTDNKGVASVNLGYGTVNGAGIGSSVSLVSSGSNIVLGGSVTLSGTVKNSSNAGVSGVSVDFYEGSVKIGSGTTNSSGVATINYTPSSVGSKVVSGVFKGNESYYKSNSNDVTVTVTGDVVPLNTVTSLVSIIVWLVVVKALFLLLLLRTVRIV